MFQIICVYCNIGLCIYFLNCASYYNVGPIGLFIAAEVDYIQAIVLFVVVVVTLDDSI